MENRKELPEMIQLFKDEFNEDLSTMNTLVRYEVLILGIEMAINDTPNDSILGSQIRKIMSDWNDTKDKRIVKAEKPKSINANQHKIELLNSEGPILTLKRTRNSFLMYDEWKFMIGKFSVESLDKFLSGKSTVTDSASRIWNYAEQSIHMRQDPKKLEEFIKVLR
jgi:hypothetical protein